jgi:hypothetical protein
LQTAPFCRFKIMVNGPARNHHQNQDKYEGFADRIYTELVIYVF